MKPKTIEVICDEVAKENGLHKPWGLLFQTNQAVLWPEVCKRYAFEVAAASLEKASENAKADYRHYEYQNIDGETATGINVVVFKSSITDPQNIVL